MDGAPIPPDEPSGNWQFKPDDTQLGGSSTDSPELQSLLATHGDPRRVVWTASEFIAHEKSPLWYLGLVGAGLVLSVVVFLITRDYITTGVILLGAIIFGVAASRQPRQVEYQVDDHGITIGRRFLSYNNFKSFSVIEDGAFASIIFMPLKRFSPLTSAYLDPKDEEAVIDIIADNLPVEERSLDAVERLMRRIRF